MRHRRAMAPQRCLHLAGRFAPGAKLCVAGLTEFHPEAWCVRRAVWARASVLAAVPADSHVPHPATGTR